MLSLPPAHLLPPTPVPSLPLVSRQHACIYTMHAAPPLQTCSAPQACTTAAWWLLALLRLPFLQSLYIVYPIVRTCIIFVQQLRGTTRFLSMDPAHSSIRTPTVCPLSWHHSLPRRGTYPLKYAHPRVPPLVAPLTSSPWNLPTQAFAHPLCVPTEHTLIGILKLAVCPLKHLHTHSVCQLRTLS